MTRRHIFREQAIQHYVQRREKDVLPRFVMPPTFLFLWILLGLCLVGAWLAWNIQFPVYTSAVGMITKGGQDGRSTAVLFAAPGQLHAIHAGQQIQLSLVSSGPFFNAAIASVGSTLLSPVEARKQYRLDGPLGLMVTQPSVVIVVTFAAGSSTVSDEGSLVQGRIQVGSQRVLSMIPLIGQMIGE